jgi:hypothetical protein
MMSTLRRLAVVGLVATAMLGISVGSAQAFEWEIGGKALGAGGLNLAQETIGSTNVAGAGAPPPRFPYTIAVPALNLSIECLEESGVGKIFPGGTGESTLTLGSCAVILPKLAFCVVGVPIVLQVKESLIKTGGLTYLVLEPLVAGGTMAKIKLTKCALAGEYPLKGAVAAETEFTLFEAVEQSISFSPAISTLVNAELKTEARPQLQLLFGLNGATLTGTSYRVLTGAHVFAEWGA